LANAEVLSQRLKHTFRPLADRARTVPFTVPERRLPNLITTRKALHD